VHLMLIITEAKSGGHEAGIHYQRSGPLHTPSPDTAMELQPRRQRVHAKCAREAISRDSSFALDRKAGSCLCLISRTH
jgi:hypothetical protein